VNRTGLAIVLAIAIVIGVAFGCYPQLDLEVSALFFNASEHKFLFGQLESVEYLRDAARAVTALLVTPALLTLLVKIIMPKRRGLIGTRAALLLALSLALGPGLITNPILKDHWGRYRPLDVIPFGGPDPFLPWYDPRGGCLGNCSFIAGEPSGAFWTVAPAALAPPQYRPIAYAAAVAFGVTVGIVRIGGGAHFFTDVVFAGVIEFLLVWILHGLLYRWRATRISDEAVDRALGQVSETLRRSVAWIGLGRRKPG